MFLIIQSKNIQQCFWEVPSVLSIDTHVLVVAFSRIAFLVVAFSVYVIDMVLTATIHWIGLRKNPKQTMFFK